MLKTRPEDYSLKHLTLDGLEIYVDSNGGRIWDNAVKATVTQIPAPCQSFISVYPPGLFKPGQWVVMGLNKGEEQWDAEIKYVEGSMICFRHKLPNGKVPKPGDIICLLRGWKRHFFDATKMEESVKVIEA